MATFLSPGVFPVEIDLSLTSSAAGPLRPVFVGTAKKGPLNEATFISNAQQAVDTFGEPFPESYMMYALMGYLEQGNQAYVVRVGVEYREGQEDDLNAVAIDTSGANVEGWGRIPLFQGIDYGKITMREVSTTKPLSFHANNVTDLTFSDRELSDTDGATDAELTFTGGGRSDDYTGDIEDNFVVLITSDPDPTGDGMEGAEYQVIRNSDSEIIAEGTLEDTAGTSQNITLEDGLVMAITLNSGRLAENDTFRFTAIPDNRTMTVWTQGHTVNDITMPTATYTDPDVFADAVNALLSGEDYAVVVVEDENGVLRPQLRTDDAGVLIQLRGSQAFADEVGVTLYAYDIPRSHVLGTDVGPYSITSSSNRVAIDVLPSNVDLETEHFEFTLPNGTSWDANDIATAVDAAGTHSGDTFFESMEFTLPGGTNHVLIVTTLDHRFDTLRLLANFSKVKTLRFAEEIGVVAPYSVAYRGFWDSRVSLPAAGADDPAVPLSCEDNELSNECLLDTAYFANIVGWLVAPSPGTWVDGMTIALAQQTSGVGDLAGRYRMAVRDADGVQIDLIDDISFDPTATRYIGNVLNPGSPIGGTNGNEYLNWEERPAYLENDVSGNDYVVRNPSQFGSRTFSGQANGIPTDPIYSSELDSAIIGNPNASTGIYAAQNAETFDANMLLTPGFNSGAVIGQCLQMCSSRGDMIYLVDPPFGLRPQQVVDWHNGMLTSDLSAAIDSSYGALYWSWIKIFDPFNNLDVWVPPSGHIAAVYSATARDAEQWYAPAGLRRGRMLTALDVEYTPSQGERDLLYGSQNSVNPIVNFPQQGITVWGQRTLQRQETALSRVNVRMLLIYLKKNLIRLLRNFVFEPNTTATWSQVQAVINPFLADVQARQGIDGYKLVVDETNNTPARRDRNQLWVSVFIKPTRAIEFVALNLVVLQSSASFNSEEVLAAGGVISR